MRNSIILLLVAVLSATTTYAENPVGYKDSIDFDFVYEMNVLPTDPGQIDLDSNTWPDFEIWQTPTVVANTTPTDGYYLELNPEPDTNFGDGIAADLFAGTVGDGIWLNSGITEATGFTVEMSVRVGEPREETMAGSGSLCIATTANERLWLTYAQESLIWGTTTTSPILDTNINTDDFHVFRMVKEPLVNRVWVYRDGILLNNESPLSSYAGGAEVFGLGCMAGTTIGSSDIDYVRFTSGAWAPVGSELPPRPPEPSDPPTDGIQYVLDTFDTTGDPAGINDELGSPRQAGPGMPETGITYVEQGSGTTSLTGGKLVMATSAQGSQTSWLDRSFTDLAGSKYGISATCSFPETQTNTNEWAALVLNEVEANDVVAGLDLTFLVRSTGWWRVYMDGTEVAGASGVPLLPADTYDVYLLIDEEAGTYDIWANRTQLVTDGAYVPNLLPERYVGVKYYGYDAVSTLSFENLLIETFGGGATPIEGDLNADGIVSSADLDIVRGNWGNSVTGAENGDPSGDGVVGSADLDIVRANWGNTAAAAVPEPSILLMLFIGVAGLSLVRRQ